MPHAPFVIPSLLQILVLTVSAVAKLRDPADSVSVFEKLKLPGFLTTLRAPQLLPYGELVVALLLLVLPGRSYAIATTLSLLLFVAYFVVVARALRFGYPLMCGCFGQLGLGWITPQTLVRNGVLVVVALASCLDSWRGGGVLQRLVHLGTGWWWVGGVLLATLTTALVVREGQPPRYPMDGSGDPEAYAATPVPYVVLDGPAGPGPVWRLTDVAARLLVFWDPSDADVARTMADRARQWQEQLGPVEVHLVAPYEWSVARDLLPEVPAPIMLGDPDGEARRRLGVYRYPGAVLLGADRFLAGGPVEGLEEIDDLVAAAAEEIAGAREQAAALEAEAASAAQ